MNNTINKSTVFIIAYCLLFSCANCKDYFDGVIKPLSIKGYVIEKYIDKKNHDYPQIVLNNQGKREVITLYYYDYHTSNLFNFLRKGDSLLKKSGSMEFVIIRDHKRYTRSVTCDE